MGWLSGWNDRKSLIDHVTAEWTTDQSITTCIRKFASGNNLWTVWERKAKLAPTDTERYIVLFMLQRFEGNTWGYKDVSEEMGPYQSTCPLGFFEMVPDPGGYATAFRARCAKAHSIKTQRFKLGEVIKLSNGRTYKVIETGRRLRG